MIYQYAISYENDDFWAIVYSDEPKTHTVFYITNTEDMCEYIKTGIMNHIDDVDGLMKFLITKGIMTEADELLISEELLN